MSDDSLFAQFVRTALPKGSWVVALRHIYFDESGTHDGSPIMTMAGYVFEAQQAERFSRDWSKVLKSYGVPFAHMTDCATGNGNFKDMPMRDRIEFNKLLIENIKRRSKLGFSVTVDPDHYNSIVKPEDGLPSAYAFCVTVCVHAVVLWAERENYKGKFSYFFESGHHNQHEANRIMNELPALGQERIEEYHYASHSFFDKLEAPPLQAADMLAWQVCHHIKRQKDGNFEARKDFRALVRPWDFNSDYSSSGVEKFRAQMLDARGNHGEAVVI